MNKIYQVVQNKRTGRWVIASERSRGNFGFGIKSAVAMAALLLAQSVHAQTIALPNFNPTTCDYRACGATVSGGANVTLTGSGTQFAPGDTGVGVATFSTLFTDGYIVSGANYADPTNPASLVINTGQLSKSILVPDPINGGNKTFSVYDNGNIADFHAASSGGQYAVQMFHEVSGQQYVDMRIGTVDSTGGILNVNIGTGGATDIASNTIAIAAKQTYITKADGSSSANSAINWTSNNFIDFGPSSMTAYAGSVQSTFRPYDTYVGTFTTAYDGSSHTVNNAADLQTYNSWLISQLQSGALTPVNYQTYFREAFTTTNQTISWTVPTLNPLDEVYKLMGDRVVILADGARATGTVVSGVHLDVNNISSSDGRGAAMMALNGGLISNKGILGVTGDGGEYTGTAMWAEGAGSRAENQAVLAVSYHAGRDGQINPSVPTEFHTNARGIYAVGSGATGSNTGIINVAGTFSTGIWARDGGATTNSGIINVGVANLPTGVFLATFTTRGALLSGSGSSFTNLATGEIYLGRSAQYTSTDATTDTFNTITPYVGIYGIYGTTATNEGKITIGNQIEGSWGMVSEGANGLFLNSGTIQINGAASSTPLENIGIWAKSGASNVQNSGIINIDGINGIGIKVTDGSVASSTGVITMNGGVSATGLHNYGIYTDGLNSRATLADGAVNMQGDGAIGVHARNGSKIVVSGGDVNFISGENQIGYFVYGTGAAVDITTAPATGLDVSTKGSTLFRIEDGAQINNTTAARLIASGENSTAVQVTGVGSSVSLDSMNVTVSGNGATGVKVEGGATGQMSNAAILSLGTNTTGVVVDKIKYSTNGAAVGSGTSIFSSSADITITGATNVTAFVVKNGAILQNSGDIHLSNGTAIEIIGAGSKVDPMAGSRGIITVDDGKAGVYVHGGADYVSHDTIIVDNAAAGLLIGADSGVITVASDAKITDNSSNYGTLIINQGAAGNAVVNGAILEMKGSGAALLMENNLDSSSSGTILVSSTTGGKGIAQSLAGGAQTTDDLTVRAGWTIEVTGNGSGVYSNTTGSLLIDGANMDITGTASAKGVEVINALKVTIAAASELKTTNANAILVYGNPETLVNDGKLTAASASATAVQLDNNDHVITNSATGTITGHVVSGNGNNNVTNAGAIAGNIALGNGTNNTTLDNASSVVNVTGGTGTNNVTVKGNAAFALLDGGIGGGSDILTFDGAIHTLSASSDFNHFETMQLTNGSTVTTADLIKMTDTAGGIGAIAIDATSKLAITAPVGYALDHALSGTGVISAQMASGTNAFSFGAGAGSAFAGTLQMGTGTFALSGINTTALTNGTLRADTGSVTTVGTGNQAIGGLTFNGGTMVFDAIVPAQVVATGTVTAAKLDISGTGTVKITVPAGFDNTQPLPNTLLPLLQQDDATAMTKLVSSGNVTGTGGALTLVDQNDVAITNAKTLDINQNSVKVAEGTYDYRMLSSSDGTTQDGLYVGYGLTQVNLIGTGVNALVLAPAIGATGLAADLSAKVIGSGDLAIAAGAGKTVSLSNALNSYSGETNVATGTLQMAAHNVLGVTSSLNLAANAGFDTNGYNQAVGELNTGIGAKANIAAGSTLTITDLQRVSGTSGGLIEAATLTGAGTLVIDPSIVSVNGVQAGYSGQITAEGGSQLKLNAANAFDNAGIALASASDKLTFGDLSATNAAWTALPHGTAAVTLSGLGVVETRDASDVTLSADNNTFAGKFDIATGTALRASEAKNLGTASILADGTFNAIANADWDLGNIVTGTGIVLKTGTGLLKVGDDSLKTFTGLTDIQAGTLQIGEYAIDDAAIGGAVRIAAGARMGGTGTVHGNVENTGYLTALNALPAYGSSGEVSGLTILGTLTNWGTVQLGGSAVGNTLTVNAINGQGGTFVINTVLGSDSSATDKVIVNGGAVTGSSFLAIVNQGGLGAQTTGNGIQVVEARNGATTVAGSFTLAGRVAAGAYEYNLARGDVSGSGDSWYLRTPTDSPAPVNPATPIIPAPTHGLRPEIPTNAAIAPLASEFGYAMLGTLHERTGGSFVNADPVFEERTVTCKDSAQNFRCVVRVPVQQGNDSQRFVTAGWARIFADKGEKSSKNFTRSGSDYDYTLGGAQIGLDIYAREQADGTLDKAGIYVGYGQVSANIRGINSGKAGSVDLDATSVGAYWTHYAASGWYTDAVIQGTWYSADARSVKGEQIKPDGFGFMASLEGGYSFKLGSGWVIEPQAQLIYQNISFDQVNDSFGTFRFQNSDSLRGRLGVRVARNWNMGDEAKPRLITAWLRANVWHEFKGDYKTTVATFQGASPYQTTTSLGGTWGEIGAGVNAQVSDNISLFATGAYQHSLDNKGRQGWNGRLGVNIKW